MTSKPLTFLEGVAADGCILAIDLGALSAEVAEQLPLARLVTLKSSQLSKALLREINPDLVVAPLFSGSSDALQLAGELFDFGYKGWFYVICDPLPNRAMVETELRVMLAQTRLCILAPPVAPSGGV